MTSLSKYYHPLYSSVERGKEARNPMTTLLPLTQNLPHTYSKHPDKILKVNNSFPQKKLAPRPFFFLPAYESPTFCWEKKKLSPLQRRHAGEFERSCNERSTADIRVTNSRRSMFTRTGCFAQEKIAIHRGTLPCRLPKTETNHSSLISRHRSNNCVPSPTPADGLAYARRPFSGRSFPTSICSIPSKATPFRYFFINCIPFRFPYLCPYRQNPPPFLPLLLHNPLPSQPPPPLLKTPPQNPTSKSHLKTPPQNPIEHLPPHHPYLSHPQHPTSPFPGPFAVTQREREQ